MASPDFVEKNDARNGPVKADSCILSHPEA